MNKTTFSMLLAALLPFAMVGCMAGPTTESDFDDDQADMGDDAEESVGEAESTLSISDCCYDLTSDPYCYMFIVSACPAGGGGTCTYKLNGPAQYTGPCLGPSHTHH